MNRILAIALFSLALGSNLTARADDNSQYKRLTIKSQVLGEERVALVRTPPGYDTNDRHYPVLYITDGDTHIAHTCATAEYLSSRAGRMPEMIVVGVINTNRTRDLTPTRATTDPKKNAPVGGGGGDKFLKFIETELVPAVEKNYRTVPFRIHAGHSYGGLLVVHSLVTKPDLFNAYIASSPSLWWDDQVEVAKLDEFLKGRKELNRTLILTLGGENEDMRSPYDKVKALLGRQQLTDFVWDSSLMEDEDHGSVTLRSYNFGLQRIFRGWQPKEETVAKGATAIEEHFKKLSDKYKFTVLPPERLTNNVAYQMLGEGKNDEAIAAFKRNAERYPNSANVYDSLAEAYEKTGKLDLARSNYERAVEVATKNKDANLSVFRTNFERVSKVLKGPGKTAG
jgi:predicted alpha/beta superfamily hydrolase